MGRHESSRSWSRATPAGDVASELSGVGSRVGSDVGSDVGTGGDSRLRALLLSPTEAGAEARWGLALAWLSAPVVEASLRVWGLSATLDWVERAAGLCVRARGARLEGEGDALGSSRKLVAAAYRAHVVRGLCLPRSVVQYGLMLARGERDARLVVGVRRDHAPAAPGAPRVGLEAHAWVELAPQQRGPEASRATGALASDDQAHGFEALYVRRLGGAT